MPFRTALRWYKKHGRDLPWRKTRDPYHILLSEIMLQQTQVDRVILHYREWLKQFPAWRSLASAKKQDVIRAWSGLGYNRRALYLQSAAEQVVKNGLPQTPDEWRKLKGVGEYTANAVSAFSQKKRVLPIDTNIRRILGRIFLGKPFPAMGDDETIKQVAMKIFPRRGTYYDIPQALFDIASLYCTKAPKCETCPLQKHCKSASSFISGKIEIPKRSISQSKEKIRPGKKYPDRIYRGRILRLAGQKDGAAINTLGKKIDSSFTASDKSWVMQMITRLEKDGLIEKQKGKIRLPTT